MNNLIKAEVNQSEQKEVYNFQITSLQLAAKIDFRHNKILENIEKVLKLTSLHEGWLKEESEEYSLRVDCTKSFTLSSYTADNGKNQPMYIISHVGLLLLNKQMRNEKLGDMIIEVTTNLVENNIQLAESSIQLAAQITQLTAQVKQLSANVDNKISDLAVKVGENSKEIALANKENDDRFDDDVRIEKRITSMAQRHANKFRTLEAKIYSQQQMIEAIIEKMETE